jgi:glutamate dehydrogenase
MRDRFGAKRDLLIASKVPAALAERLARIELAELVPDVALVAHLAKAGIRRRGEGLFRVTDALRISRIEEAARALSPSDYYDAMALSRAEDTIDAARRGNRGCGAERSCQGGRPGRAWLEAGGRASAGCANGCRR